MSEKNKNEIISSIYYEPAGYGSIANTFKEAHKIDKSITLADIKLWFNKNIERTTQIKGYNSFVAPYAYYEFQLDLFFITEDNQNYKIGMIVIDIFSKYITVIPIKSKSEADVAAGMLESFVKQGKKPKILYTDDELAFKTKLINKYYEDNNIEHIITRTSVPFADRAIRTIKSMLYKRWHDKSKPWYEEPLFQTLLVYNNKLINSSTGYTPLEARKKENEFDVRLHLQMHAKRNRKYPQISVGDKVRVYKKSRNAFIKEANKTKWSTEKYEVEEISESHGQNFYKVSGYTRPLLRHEILKV